MTQVTLNNGSVDSAGSLLLKTNGTTTAVTIDTAQNMGLGVTPSAWDTSNTTRALQVSNGPSIYGFNIGGASPYAWFGSNDYRASGGTNRYVVSASASAYYQNGGAHYWLNAASGTAGNAVTFTQAMTLNASGNLGVGTTSPTTKLQVVGTGRFSSGTEGIGLFHNGSIGYIETSGSSATPIGFANGGVERARIDSSGNLLVGITSTINAGKTVVSFDGSTQNGIVVKTTYASTGSDFMQFFNSAGSVAGKITQNGTTTVAYTTSSDYRLKENITPMAGALATVSQLNPVTYSWKSDGSDGQGFIAHELQAVLPDAVVGEKDAVDADGNPKYQGIDTSFLVATLTAAIQEQQAIITSLTARIEALEA